MTIYLGDTGGVELRRAGTKDTFLRSILANGDVDVANKRFSFDEAGTIITGDRIEIGTQDGSTLVLVQGHNYPDGSWYAHVDSAGGIRLYDDFDDAVNDDATKALALEAVSRDQPIYVRTVGNRFNCLSRVTNYQLTTSRESIDLTCLGNDFRDNYENGLISGQGSLSCLWGFSHQMCEEGEQQRSELPHYFAQLLLRLKQGALFEGRFFVYRSTSDDAVYYLADCIVTNVAFSVAPSDVIRTEIEFVTTGEIALKMGRVPSYLLQEDDELILQEDGDGIFL